MYGLHKKLGMWNPGTVYVENIWCGIRNCVCRNRSLCEFCSHRSLCEIPGIGVCFNRSVYGIPQNTKKKLCVGLIGRIQSLCAVPTHANDYFP